jgi:5-methyltetrahydrofolate--homocysteine methyltransferase
MHGHEAHVAEFNRAAAQVARRAVTNGQLVLGDVGPFGGFIEPLGDTTPDEALAIFTQQIEALRDGGADGVIIETMSDPQELAVAVQAAKRVADWPVIATFCFQKAGDRFVTLMGLNVKAAMRAAIEAGADVVGTNCGTALSLEDYTALAREIVAAAGDHPTIMQPNAGSPIERDGQLHYGAGPGEFAQAIGRILAAGIRIVGGCCGTTPAHIAAARSVVHPRFNSR